MKSKRAFTLVEVVVVIGIIAVLTVIIFPSISNIRAKNRDTERIADIAAIQLGLSLFYNQNGEYATTTDLRNLVPKYLTLDVVTPPNDDSEYQYVYVPLKKTTAKCTYYHLGTKLELPSTQIDAADNFSSLFGSISNYYSYCAGFSGPGIQNSTTTRTYAVHP